MAGTTGEGDWKGMGQTGGIYCLRRQQAGAWMRARGDACVIMFAQNRGGLLGFRHVCMCGYVKVWMEPCPEREGQVRVYARGLSTDGCKESVGRCVCVGGGGS